MKKLLAFMVALFTVILMGGPLTGTAEAAYVAVVPIDIDVDKVERSGDLNGYYWDLVIDKFQYPDYELLDDEKVSAVYHHTAGPALRNRLQPESAPRLERGVS